VAVSALAYAFVRRNDNWITPEHGLGYLFGLVGTILMLILLGYPLRKRFRFMRDWGKLPNWLNFHMVLGIFGPTLVIFQSNFKLGATNSAVALLAMVTVVSSGIIGRYIYDKTHNRLTGELRSLQDLREEMQDARDEVGFDLSRVPTLSQALDDLESRILSAELGLLSSLDLYFEFMFSVAKYRRHLMRLADQVLERSRLAPQEIREVRKLVGRYFTLYLQRLSRAAGFRFYERVFALWHVLHVPLLFLLIAATTVHVVAVHLY
jgi:hypothetical protein